MALTHRTLVELYGAAATHVGDNLDVTPSQLGTAGNVTTPGALSPEGLTLALLQRLFDQQGTDAARTMTITKSTPVIVVRGGATVQGERYTVTVYSPNPIGTIDPDDV